MFWGFGVSWMMIWEADLHETSFGTEVLLLASGGLGVPENGRGGSFIGAPSLAMKNVCSMQRGPRSYSVSVCCAGWTFVPAVFYSAQGLYIYRKAHQRRCMHKMRRPNQERNRHA